MALLGGMTGMAAVASATDLPPPEADPKPLHDPFRPPALPKEIATSGHPDTQWHLGLVRLTNGAALAVINDKIVYPGQSVDGFMVEKIDLGGVLGSVNHQPLTLTMDINRAGAGMVVRSAAAPAEATP